MGGWLSNLFGRPPESENPTVQEIEALQAERARQVEADANAVREGVGLKEGRARTRQKVAKRAPALAAEENGRLKAEIQEERGRSQKVKEDAERAVQAAREEARRAQKAAQGQRRAAEQRKTLAEQMARTAPAEARRANEARADAERRSRKSIQPVVTPTLKELAKAKRRIQYREDCFHFAVVGISGSGKSSLVNAFRGLRSNNSGAAAVGVTETTVQMTRYQNVNPESPYVWYDVPGAGTLECSGWQYFNDQGLYVFDCIIVLIDNRFTETDIAILTNARRFNIPTYIVRSKADQHIRNLKKEMGYNSDRDYGDFELRERLSAVARKKYIKETRMSVHENLQKTKLPGQRVYIISNDTLFGVVLHEPPNTLKVIHEKELINDLIEEAYARRQRRPALGLRDVRDFLYTGLSRS